MQTNLFLTKKDNELLKNYIQKRDVQANVLQ
jgi:hypothetical protein